MRREYPELPIVACGVLIVKDGRVLLVRRRSDPGRGWWAIPGGVVNLGEKVEEAAEREILEETGLKIKIERLLSVIDNIVYDEQKKIKFHYVIIDYLAHPISECIRADSDVDQIMWSDYQQMISLPVLPLSRKLIEETMNWNA